MISRRTFLQASGAGAAGLYLGGPELVRAAGPNEKLNVACIGVGGQGASNVGGVKSQNIIAFCDVDELRAAKTFDAFPKVERFTDFRVMFDKLDSKIDAVTISTPDHTHYHPAAWAIRRKKHIYLEKPMAPSVGEVRALTRMAEEAKVATQLGMQRHALAGMRQVVAIVQAGLIGDVKEVVCWLEGQRGDMKYPATREASPKTLDWELWLGPRAPREYVEKLAPYDWRFYWEFGTGDSGNWGCHILDTPFWALGLTRPTKVERINVGEVKDPHCCPKTMTTRMTFAGKSGEVKVIWAQGVPDEAKKIGDTKGYNTFLVGSKGTLAYGFDKWKLLDGEIAKDKLPEAMPKSPGFHNEWIAAAKGGKPATCHFGYSGPLAESVVLANVAARTGDFAYDPDKAAVSGNEAAAKLLSGEFPYRKGWEDTGKL